MVGHKGQYPCPCAIPCRVLSINVQDRVGCQPYREEIPTMLTTKYRSSQPTDDHDQWVLAWNSGNSLRNGEVFETPRRWSSRPEVGDGDGGRTTIEL